MAFWIIGLFVDPSCLESTQDSPPLQKLAFRSSTMLLLNTLIEAFMWLWHREQARRNAAVEKGTNSAVPGTAVREAANGEGQRQTTTV